MRLRLLPVLAVLTFVFLAARPAAADSIVYQGVSGNKYSYGLDTAAVLQLAEGSTIDFTGLSGVTNATDSLPSLFNVSFTSDSVTYTVKSTLVETFFDTYLFSNLLSITSMAPPGSINYSIDAKSFDMDGSVAGPVLFVAATPEPSSLLLLGTGLIGIAGVVAFMRKIQVDA